MVLIIIRALFLGMLAVPLAWFPVQYYKVRKQGLSGSSIGYSKWTLVGNSAILYAIAFNLIFFTQELFLALGKQWLGLRAYLYHNNHSWDGQHPLTPLAQGYGALAIFVTGILCLVIFLAMKNSKGMLRLFFLWMSFQGFAQSLPQVPIAFLAPDTDTGQAFAYLALSPISQVLISAISIALYVLVITRFSGWLLSMAPEHVMENERSRFNYLRDIAIMSAVLGVVLIIPFRLPPVQKIMAPILVTLFAMPWIMINYKARVGRHNSNSANSTFSWIALVALAVLLAIFQLILAPGVAFN